MNSNIESNNIESISNTVQTVISTVKKKKDRRKRRGTADLLFPLFSTKCQFIGSLLDLFFSPNFVLFWFYFGKIVLTLFYCNTHSH